MCAIAQRRAIAAARIPQVMAINELVAGLRTSYDVTARTQLRSSFDGDRHKGAIEDDHPCDKWNAPGLDDNGLPNDEIAIAEDAIGARERCSRCGEVWNPSRRTHEPAWRWRQ